MKPSKMKVLQNTIRIQSVLIHQREIEAQLEAINERLDDAEASVALQIDEAVEQVADTLQDEVAKQVKIQMALLKVEVMNLLEVNLKVIADDVQDALNKLDRPS